MDALDESQMPRLWEDALASFGRAPSSGAAQLLSAARGFWTSERTEKCVGFGGRKGVPACLPRLVLD